MSRYFLFLTVMCIAAINANGQFGKILGMVKDQVNQIPVAGANINITSNYTENSDEYGQFLIEEVKPGSYEMIVTHIGYKTEIIPLEVKPGITSTISIDLKKDNLNLTEVKVNSVKTNPLQTLSAVDILLRPVNTSQDILRIVPGLFIAQHAGGGKAEQIFLRGYDIDHGTDINISVDGMPVNMVSHAHGQGYADLHFLIPETVEKVDFDKGPYHAEKGNLATAAYVDFATKDFLEQNQLKIEAGQFNTFRAVGLLKIFNKQNDKSRQQLYAATEFSSTDGYFQAPQDFHRLNLMTKYTAWLGNQSKLSITASTFDSRWNASGQVPLRAVSSGLINRFGSIDNSEGGNTGRSNFNIRFNRQWKNNWKSTDQFYYSRYHFKLYSNFTFFLEDSINGDEIMQKESRDLFGYNTSATKSWFLGGMKAATIFGAGFRFDNIHDIQLAKVVKRIFLTDVQRGDVKETNVFMYVNQDITLNKKWSLNAGLRYDQFNFQYRDNLSNAPQFEKTSKGVFSPKLNFNFVATKKLKFYFNNGVGFHSNDTRVILEKNAKEILPRVIGTDLGVIWKPLGKLIIKTALWHLYAEQEFVYVGDAGIIEPSGKSRRIGIDVSGRYQFNDWLFGDIDINLTKARAIEESKGNDYIPLAPSFTSIGGLTVKSPNGFSGSLRYRFIADRPANEDNSVTAKGYCIADALIEYRLKNIQLRAGLENIFNIDWREAQFDTESRLKNETNPVAEIHFTPGTPRFFKAGIVLNF